MSVLDETEEIVKHIFDVLPGKSWQEYKKILGRMKTMTMNDTQMDRLEARFGANYQAPARKLNAGDIAIAFALGLSLAAMLIL